MKNKKVLAIGDSFCQPFYQYEPEKDGDEKCFWVDYLKENLTEYEVICDGWASRDAQTIVDNWIKCIPNLYDDDFLIICLPYFRRTRLPYHEKHYDTFESSDFRIKYINRFVGTPSYHRERERLEFWDQNYNKQYFLETLQNQEIINTSKAFQLNFIEIVESLKKITKSRVYVFSWDVMDYKSDIIDDKSDLIKKIGMWETNYDVYNKTNGLKGFKGDCHWSHPMSKKFGEFIYEKINNL